MRFARAERPAGVPGLLLATSLTQSEVATITALAIASIGLLAAMFAPPAGTILMEIGFPILAGWFLVRKTGDRFAPAATFPAFYLLWYWIASIPLIKSDQSGSAYRGIDDQVWFYCLLGFVAFLCGTLVVRGEESSLALRGLRVQWREEQLLLFLGFVAAGILLAWASITVSEGIPILKSDVETLRVELPARHHIAFQIMVAFSDLMLPLIFLYLWTAPSAKFRKTFYAFSLFIVFIFVSQGNRGLVLPAVLTIFALRHYLRKPWPVRQLVVAGLIIAPLLSVSGYYRSLQHFGPTYALDLVDMGIPIPLQPFSIVYLSIRAPVETFRSVIVLIPTLRAFQHGDLSFGFISQLLPGRHPSSDFFFKNLLGHTFEGFGEPASVLGTFYGDFGVTGIVAGMFFTGLFTKLIYVHMFRGSLGWLLVYCYLWQKLIGSLYGSLFTYVIEILLPIAWIISVRAFSTSERHFAIGADVPTEGA